MNLKPSSCDTPAAAKSQPTGADDPGPHTSGLPGVAGRADEDGHADKSGQNDKGSRPGLFRRMKNMLWFRKNGSLRQDLEVVLGQGDADLTFTPEERSMLSNILVLREVRADDVMVPRADIDGVDVTITLGQLIFLFEESRHSRMPVYRETLDDPIGMVHVKDLMAYVMDQAQKNPKDAEGSLRNDVVDYDLSNVDLSQTLDNAEILRPVLFVPPSMPAFDIFAKMQATRSQMALVIDEYGGTDGLVSMEDVVEAIVGDIEDEHDDETSPLIVKEGENRWSADARTPLKDMCEALGISYNADDGDDDVDTIGGLLFTELGRVPVRGEVVHALENFDFEVIEADPRRIRRLRIVPSKPISKRRRKRPADGSEGATLASLVEKSET